jgi:hypothetical protein
LMRWITAVTAHSGEPTVAFSSQKAVSGSPIALAQLFEQIFDRWLVLNLDMSGMSCRARVTMHKGHIDAESFRK